MDNHTTPLKRCTKCGNEYPATTEHFNKNCQANDGLHPNCKACRSVYRQQNHEHIYQQKRRWRQTNPDREKSRVLTWIAANRQRYLDKKCEYYRKNKTRILAAMRIRYFEYHEEEKEKRRQYYALNKNWIRINVQRMYRDNTEFRNSVRERVRQWRIQNPEQYRAMMKVASARRRLREKNAEGSFTREDLSLQYRSQRGRCWWCGCELNGKYHADHLTALVRNGSNDPRNIVLSCATCNLSKGGKPPWLWIGRLF
jgi:hypothetical protein